jgi:hypothetical protein
MTDEANWSRRYKANLERMRSGDRDQITEVVSGLGARERDHGLSAGERRMLERTRHLTQGSPGPAEAGGVREPRPPSSPSPAGRVALGSPAEPQT